MEKLMDHYGNVAAERKLRTPGSKRRPAGSGVEAGGGVRARAWQAAAGKQQGSWSLLALVALVASLMWRSRIREFGDRS
ncbi:hypothetical protein PR003_g6876 [Phytophthora rubi]|uniref:Uncharacterized protein n=1 Tax=Phytophthora rubi TaxID=129364 RepID=A0A6A4FNK6_9STRA|nr:hypothetical protein PR003_g6876 [Phytophthora rubi]